MSEVDRLMKDYTKRELAEALAAATDSQRDVTSDNAYTASVLDISDTRHGTVHVTLEVDATTGELILIREGHRVSLSMNDDLPADLARWSS